MKNVGGPSLLESFFTERLIAQRRVSPHTIASYRDTFRLLLQFSQKRLRKPPSQLTLADLNAPCWASFWMIWKRAGRMVRAAAICG